MKEQKRKNVRYKKINNKEGNILRASFCILDNNIRVHMNNVNILQATLNLSSLTSASDVEPGIFKQNMNGVLTLLRISRKSRDTPRGRSSLKYVPRDDPCEARCVPNRRMKPPPVKNFEVIVEHNERTHGKKVLDA